MHRGIVVGSDSLVVELARIIGQGLTRRRQDRPRKHDKK